jgi:mannose-6-phosphate isomerase
VSPPLHDRELPGAATPGSLERRREALREWLVQAAYPAWFALGIDRAHGGFHEALGQDGTPLAVPHRARVQPRQVYAFARAAEAGWDGDGASVVRGGLAAIDARWRRPDGLVRTLLHPDGRPLDERALLYDQTFVLLALAAAARALDELVRYERAALALRDAIERAFAVANGEFLSGEPDPEPRLANPHMHLLEACLAWARIGQDRGWTSWAESLADVGLERFRHRGTGALLEARGPGGGPAPGADGRRVEPGHQFEWAWLLLRMPRPDGRRVAAALALIALTERHGVRGGVAVNALDDGLAVTDPGARLWPQAERLKAALAARAATGEERFAAIAAEAAGELWRYLETPRPGLWYDLRRPDGSIADGPVQASTFYHLVTAILEPDD